MARFDLSKYATVAERLQMLEEAYPDYRIETEDYSSDADRAKGVWRVRAQLFLDGEEQYKRNPKATGHAFEVDGQPGANTTSALENAETSAVGRAFALASARWSGNKDDAARSLASREEMEKVQRGRPAEVAPPVPEDFLGRIQATETEDDLHKLWDEAVKGGFSGRILHTVRDRKAQIVKVGNAQQDNK